MTEIFHILLSLYCALFITSIALEDNSIADVFWGIGFIVISGVLFFYESSQSWQQILVLGLISIWGLRLFSLFVGRKRKKKGEDPRYAQWRKKWKYFYMRSFFQVYILQMLLMLMVATPLFFIFTSSDLNTAFTVIGSITALVGLIYEIIADKQIVDFLKRKKKGENKVYTGGLWKYSRHPNYFGESVFWLGISIISLPISLFGIVGYVVITGLLLFVSGVPMKEKRQSRKDNWEVYTKETNMFIPNFSKK